MDEQELGPPPGYTGHLPRYVNTYGASYGRIVRAMETDPTIPRGRTPILSRTHAPRSASSSRRPQSAAGAGEDGDEHLSFRDKKVFAPITDHRVGNRLKSGYTGYVPRLRENFGETYGSATYNSLNEFTQATQAHKHEVAELSETVVTRAPLARTGNRPGTTSYSYHPGTPVETADPSFIRPNTSGGGRGTEWEETRRPRSTSQSASARSLAATRGVSTSFDVEGYTTSPYNLPLNHARKYFIPAYTGHVPRMQNYVARNYCDTTRDALNSLTAEALEELAHDGEDERTVIMRNYSSGGARAARPPSPPRIRPIPGSTVHVPGYSFATGDTYGHTTRKLMPNSR